MNWKRLAVQVSLAMAAWAAVLLLAAFYWSGTGSLLEALSGIGAALWAATFALFAVSHGLRFARWHWMLAIEGHRIPAARSLAIFMAGLGLLPTPAKAGVAVRSLLLLDHGVPVNVSLAVYFAERLFDFLGLVVLAALAFGAGPRERWVVALLAGSVAIVAVIVGPHIAAWMEPRLRAGSRSRRAVAWSHAFLQQGAELVAGRRFVPFWALGVAANLATALLLWLTLAALDTPIGFEQAAATLGIAHLSGSLSLLPGGLGGFEAAMLAHLSILGVHAAPALAALALVRLATIWGSVAIGLPCLVYILRPSPPTGYGR